MCHAQVPQHSDACEAQTRGLSVLIQALYHWATAPLQHLRDFKQDTSLFVCILVFMSSWNFVLSWVEHEKSFLTSGPVFEVCDQIMLKPTCSATRTS